MVSHGTHSTPAPRAEHLAERPSWDCRVCQQPWPCAVAKVDLATEYLQRPTALTFYLSTYLYQAIEDMRTTTRGSPAGLTERFLHWVITPAPTTLVVPGPFVGMGEIRDLLLEISKERVESLTVRSDFPEPVDELAAGAVWLLEDVEAWIDQHCDALADMLKTSPTT